MSNESSEKLNRVPSHIRGLDEVLQGGFIKGGLYIVEGVPGTGKTILGNQICFNEVKAGGMVLYVTLIAETVGRMLLNLRHMRFFDESAIGNGIFYISGFSALKNEGLSGLLHLIRHEVSAHRSSIVVIDGFASASDSARSPEEMKIFVQQMQTQADTSGCTVFLLTNPVEAKPAYEETMVDGIINLCSTLQASSSLREIHVRKFRGSSYLEGVHSYQISEEGIIVYPRMETLVSPGLTGNGAVQRISSGIPILDTMLGGGVPSRSMTMLVGPSGTGKTTLGLQFLSQSTKDEPGLLFGFYESPARIQTKARAMFTALAQGFESGLVEILWRSPGEHLLDDLANSLLEAVKHKKVRRLLIDGLAGFRKALRSRPIEPFFAALVEELRSEGVTTICTAEVAEIIGPTITAPLNGLSDVTDNHVLLRFIETGASLYRLISILKVRDSSFDSGLRQLTITGTGIEIAEDHRSTELILSSLAGRPASMEITVGQK